MVLKSKFADVELPGNPSLTNFIFQKTKPFPSATALIDPETDRHISYREVMELVRRVAHSLHQRGLRKGDILMTVIPNHVMYPVLVLAVPYLGAILTTANPEYVAAEIRDQIYDVEPTFFITLSAMAPKVQDALQGYGGVKELFVLDTHPGCTPFSDLLLGNPHFESDVIINAKEDVAFLLYSSGTTGKPKGAMLTHYNIVSNIIQSSPPIICIDVLPREVYLCVLPFYHSYALGAIVGQGLARGNCLVVLPKFQLNQYLEACYKYKVTLLHVVPPIILALSRASQVRRYLCSVHTMLSAAAPLGSEMEAHIMAVTGISNIRQGYGLTETAPEAAVVPQVGGRQGSVGTPIPNTEIKVVEPSSRQELGVNEKGEICIRGPQVMKGYWKRPQATADMIDKRGWLHTGDIGYYDQDGNLFVVDRIKELIKWNGFQVAPSDLESLILTRPDVLDVAVVGVPDHEAGEVPRAYVVKKPGTDVTQQQIIDFVASKVSPHKKLRGGVEFLHEIPKSGSGKTLRRVLKARFLPIEKAKL